MRYSLSQVDVRCRSRAVLGVLSLAVWAWAACPPVSGQTITLDFNSLPSAQGWTYSGPVAESSIFSVGGGALHQNSFGIGSDVAYYSLPAVDVTKSFTLSFRGRVLGEENGTPTNAYGFTAEVLSIDRVFSVGLGTNRITLDNDGSPVSFPFDATQFHNYVLVGDKGTNAWQLFIDGTSMATGIARLSPGSSNNLYLGDITNGPNAQGEWTQYTFSQAVPEPSTYLLIGLTAVGVAGYGWRQRRVRRMAEG